MSDMKALWKALASLKLTLACLVLLMAVVLICTFDQVQVGIWAAVARDVRSFWIFWTPPGGSVKLPIFPGGGLVGALLLVNLTAASIQRFRWERRKLGIWLVHSGVALLVLGEFVTAFFAVESQMAIQEGQTLNYTEAPPKAELAVLSEGGADEDEVFAVDEGVLSRKSALGHARWPFTLKILEFFQNSELSMRGKDGGPSRATAGAGTGVAVRRLPPVSADDRVNRVSAYVEAESQGKSLGVWLLSTELGAPQSFEAGGRRWRLALRPRRYYLPYSVTLEKFTRVMYPNTDIPKSFSSRVRLLDPEKGEDRGVLIYMNAPLRYRGHTYYQASFGRDDTLSVLQVVENPGWLVPYVACALAAAGLLIQFLTSFAGSRSLARPAP